MFMKQMWVLDCNEFLEAGQAALSLRSLRFELALANPEEFVQTSEACKRIIEPALQRHVLVPTVLGQRKAKTKHSFYNYCHSLKLEHYSWQAVAGVLKASFHLVLDGGERKIRRCKVYSADYFAWWSRTGTEMRDDRDGEFDVEGAEDEHALLDATGSFTFHGMFHWLEIVLKTTLRKLGGWQENKGFLNSLVIYFHKWSCRQEFLAESDCWEFEALFRKGPPLLNGGRDWMALTLALEWIDERYEVIMTKWPFVHDPNAESAGDADPFAEDNLDPEIAVEEISKHRNEISAGVRSPFKWEYVFFFQVVRMYIGHIENWLRGCPCHPMELLRQLKMEHFNCPLRGCRVIDVASDEFDKCLDRASQLHHAKLLAKLPNGLSEEEHSIIVLDFGVLKSNLFSAAGLRTK